MNHAQQVQDYVRHALTSSGDAKRARQQQAYMKSAMPYAGVAMPAVKQIAKATLSEHPPNSKSQWLAGIGLIWDEASYREERHLALELLAHKKLREQWLTVADLARLKRMIRSGAWWDLVDPLAINHVGFLLAQNTASLTPKMYRWAEERDLWVRRSAILSQLKAKQHTNQDLLSHAILASIDDNDFFARKGIGWALREYSKTHPRWVIQFIDQHQARLSALSIREGLKHVAKQAAG